ncbi:hypothetical protein B0G57_1292 [Trinickia symbiotica]|nr:hypothetical protein [Trinickia symbiotica]PPK41460.1 hypothetical protein B0G57_1292 [Trinickia symbiotica]
MAEARLIHLIAQLLGNREVISYSPPLARAIGDVEATIFLCQACYWQSQIGVDEWFYKLRDAERNADGRMQAPRDASRQSWEWETGLSRTRQESARRRLKLLGLLEESLQGIPAKLYYRVNLDRLTEFLLETREHQLAGILPTGREGCSRQGGRKASSKPDETTPTNTETTAEISNTDTTTTPPAIPARSASGSADAGRSSGGIADSPNLILEKSVEAHRELLKNLLAGLPAEVAQGIADELAGALEAASAGKRVPINSVRGWVLSLIERHHVRQFTLEHGRTVAL